MKRENFNFLFIIIAVSILLVAQFYEGPITITISSDSPPVKYGDASFPGPKNLQSISYSVVQTHYQIFHTDEIIETGNGHGFIYSHNGEYSYLALPSHCFPYDSTKQSKIWVTDYKGERIDIDWVRMLTNSYYDAKMLKVKRIFNLPSLCEMAALTGNHVSGDSVLIFNPFNSRGVGEKWGAFISEERVKMKTMISEPGDSGGLVISRDGITGIATSVSDNGSTMHYVPILVFEGMYGDFMFNKN